MAAIATRVQMISYFDLWGNIMNSNFFKTKLIRKQGTKKCILHKNILTNNVIYKTLIPPSPAFLVCRVKLFFICEDDVLSF